MSDRMELAETRRSTRTRKAPPRFANERNAAEKQRKNALVQRKIAAIKHIKELKRVQKELKRSRSRSPSDPYNPRGRNYREQNRRTQKVFNDFKKSIRRPAAAAASAAPMASANRNLDAMLNRLEKLNMSNPDAKELSAFNFDGMLAALNANTLRAPRHRRRNTSRSRSRSRSRSHNRR